LPMMNIIVGNAKGGGGGDLHLDLVRKSHVTPPGVATLATDDTRVALRRCSSARSQRSRWRNGRRCLVTERKPRAGRWWAGLTFWRAAGW
jgi:hypothetical protein